MRNPVHFAWTIVVLAVVACVGCASSKPNQEAAAEPNPALRAAGQPVTPVGPASNEEIGFEIRRRLNENPSATAGIIVEVDEGNVTLRGTAPNLAAAWRAEATARAVKGVKQVTNQIIVPSSTR